MGWIDFCFTEIWPIFSQKYSKRCVNFGNLYTSLLSINQQDKVTKVSEVDGGNLKPPKMTKIIYKTYI